VNNVDLQLRKFLSPFKGTSSKYLQNYLNWYGYVDNIKSNKEIIKRLFLAVNFKFGFTQSSQRR